MRNIRTQVCVKMHECMKRKVKYTEKNCFFSIYAYKKAKTYLGCWFQTLTHLYQYQMTMSLLEAVQLFQIQ